MSDQGSQSEISRRSLLGGVAAAGMMMLPGAGLAAPRKLAPSDRINFAVIGAGGMGGHNVSKISGHNLVALADVHMDHLPYAYRNAQGGVRPDRQNVKDAFEKAARFTDYRRMFDRRKDIDAMII